MIELPTGTVTFLFTDIQGSTPLWEQAPEAMRPAVAAHNTLLRRAVETNGGVVFKVIGDAFQAAFPLADRALNAALQAQRSLLAAAWPPETGPLKVRMGLHTGPAEVDRSADGIDYAVSHTLNRVARIMSAGAGGQVLLSRETADLVERSLPAGATLKDLGEHHLKGMARAERLFQVCAPGLPDDFPPLASSAVPPHNLPAQLTSFIGREAELAALQRLVTGGTARLATLTGPGGTGKTRLALRAAASLLYAFPDGVWLVELAPLADPSLVPLTVAGALGLHETPGKPIPRMLVDHVGARRLLLILDNCEHVVEEAAALAGLLLQSCPNLQILATSREILGTQGETPFRVPSLSLPGPQNTTLSDLAGCESVRLFVDRARTAQPGFSLTEINAPVVARICQRLDGIPLAIELAAARARVLTVEQIAARLDDAFRLLTGGSRTVLSRHQTLRALIDWSYNLLSPDERALYTRLSVFAGGFILEAAEYVCSDPSAGSREDSGAAAGIELEPEAVLDLLTQLVDKSLVIALEASGPLEANTDGPGPEAPPETRYRMLETIRQYARDKLHDTGGGGAVRDRHLAYFLLLAEEAEPYLRRGSQVAWLDRLDAELDNIRLALEWSQARRVDEGLRLAASLLWFWHIRGHGREGIEWLEHLLAAGKRAAVPESPLYTRLIRARALVAAGFLTQFQFGTGRDVELLEEAVELLRQAGPAGRRWLGVALLFLSKPLRDHDQRVQLMADALPLLREAGDPLYLAEYSMDLGGILVGENKFSQATAAFLESLAWREESQDLDGLGTAALALGDMALFRRDFAECTRLYEKSLACYQKVKNRNMESLLLSRLGNIDLLTGNFTQAAEHFAAGIALNQQTGDRLGMVNSLFDLGRLELNVNEFRRASRRFAEIASIGAELGSKEAELIGLLFQGLAAKEMGELHEAEEFTRRTIDFWRGLGKTAFSPGFTAGNLDTLAVLLLDRRPELAARVFSAIDQVGLVTHELNTPVEVVLFENARVAIRQALGEERYAAAAADGKKLSIEQALELVFAAQ
jgi:predicted ATPase/class 3 adenylate cyclase